MSPLSVLEKEDEIYLEENSLLWKLNTQLVNADHVTVFEMLMYGVFFDWLLRRMENPPRLASGGVYEVTTHTYTQRSYFCAG